MVAVLFFYFHMKQTFQKALATPSNKKPFYTFCHVASFRINREKYFTISQEACSNPYMKNTLVLVLSLF